MASNDFLVWAPGGANVMSQGSYSTNAYLANGVVTGIADNTLYNKSVRQSSIMAAIIADFIVQELNVNVTDDGTTATILTNFTNALLALTGTIVRTRLTSATTFYVATTGNDSNNGLTPGTAFLTLQALANYLYVNYDFGDQPVIIKLADGTYSGANFPGSFTGQTSSLNITGNSTTPSNVQLISTGFDTSTISAYNNANITVSYMELSSTGTAYGGYALNASNGSIGIGPGIIFGACNVGHMVASFGGLITATNVPYTIAAAAPLHMACQDNGIINVDGSQIGGVTITVTGSPNFSNAFAQAVSSGSINVLGVTFSGSATGIKFNAALNGVINNFGGGGSGFPGSVAGVTSQGGQIN